MKLLLVALLFVATVQLSFSQKPVKLFNGKNLKNWEIVLKEESAGTAVFYVHEGILNASGTPFGYIRTKQQFENYELTLEWRWAGEPTNSGVLLHIVGNDGVWPHCIEAQLMNQNAGDLVLMQTGAKATVQNQSFEIKEGDRWASVIKKQQDSSENKPGEWNSYRIVSHNGKLELFVNGVLQNTASSFSPNKGYIGLQSEGSQIQFRNIMLKKLRK